MDQAVPRVQRGLRHRCCLVLLDCRWVRGLPAVRVGLVVLVGLLGTVRTGLVELVAGMPPAVFGLGIRERQGFLGDRGVRFCLVVLVGRAGLASNSLKQ